MYFPLAWCAFLLSSAPFSFAVPTSTDFSAPPSRACGKIVNSGEYYFAASLAYECLTSVPFNPAISTRFIKYYNDTIQFQSTLAYLKNPTNTYQQPAVDLVGGLEQLQLGINNGIFPNQYEFEATLFSLIQAAHDAHLSLVAGALAVFSFGSLRDIVSVSADGIQIPKVYIATDWQDYEEGGKVPSAITTINGIEVTKYLSDFAAKNSFGNLEPHSDWNQLMLSPIQDVQGTFSVFGGSASLYPGESITFKLDNGTELTDDLFAYYYDQGPTGPLETGGDFYNYFVLGLYPFGFDPNFDNTNNNTGANSDNTASIINNITDSSSMSGTTSNNTEESKCAETWNSSAYPKCPDIAQRYLGDGGVVSGYFLNYSEFSVLSIPSFEAQDESLKTFQSTVADFIQKSLDTKRSKVVIDLQGNTGGQPLLAIDTFKQFFPNIDPFCGSRLRAHPFANTMGQIITSNFTSLNSTGDDYFSLAANEWVSSNRLNAATDTTFKSWSEFFGSSTQNDYRFTTTQKYALSDSVFVDAAVGFFDGSFSINGYESETGKANSASPFVPENIIILTDGLCSSACSLFLEMMQHEAGVRVVVVGGKPIPGPMQASSSRGAIQYDIQNLDSDIYYTQEILETYHSQSSYFISSRENNLDVFVSSASVNLRDQVRSDDSTPLQFTYQAADCRIYYTPKTVFNFMALWQYAADAIWTHPSLCVAGSTGFSMTANRTTKPPPSTEAVEFSVANAISHLSANSDIAYFDDGFEDGGAPGNLRKYFTCKAHSDCKASEVCLTIPELNNSSSICFPTSTCEGSQKLCSFPIKSPDKPLPASCHDLPCGTPATVKASGLQDACAKKKKYCRPEPEPKPNKTSGRPQVQRSNKTPSKSSPKTNHPKKAPSSL